MYSVILAGGSGTRFWPQSRSSKPKQLLKLNDEQTMLAQTIARVRALPTTQEVFVETREDLAAAILDAIPTLSPEHIIAEPDKKNTAAAIGLAALFVMRQNPEAVMGVFHSDHIIGDIDQFAAAVAEAEHVARDHDVLVAIGVTPSYAATGFGYIESIDTDKGGTRTREIRAFTEKPNESLAREFVRGGKHLWNAGMFVWKARVILEAIAEHMPELHHALLEVREHIDKGASFDHIWNTIHPEAIDTGVMEKAQGACVVAGEFEWSDVGSWRTMHDLADKEDFGNAIVGDGMVVNGENNLIQTTEDHFTAVVGLDDVIVVHTDDATLVVAKSQAEEVKRIVHALKERDRKDLL